MLEHVSRGDCFYRAFGDVVAGTGTLGFVGDVVGVAEHFMRELLECGPGEWWVECECVAATMLFCVLRVYFDAAVGFDYSAAFFFFFDGCADGFVLFEGGFRLRPFHCSCYF